MFIVWYVCSNRVTPYISRATRLVAHCVRRRAFFVDAHRMLQASVRCALVSVFVLTSSYLVFDRRIRLAPLLEALCVLFCVRVCGVCHLLRLRSPMAAGSSFSVGLRFGPTVTHVGWCVRCPCNMFMAYGNFTHVYVWMATSVCDINTYSQCAMRTMYFNNDQHCIYGAPLFCSAKSCNGWLSSPADTDTRTRTHLTRTSHVTPRTPRTTQHATHTQHAHTQTKQSPRRRKHNTHTRRRHTTKPTHDAPAQSKRNARAQTTHETRT